MDNTAQKPPLLELNRLALSKAFRRTVGSARGLPRQGEQRRVGVSDPQVLAGGRVGLIPQRRGGGGGTPRPSP